MTSPDDPLSELDFPTPTQPPHERMRGMAARFERAVTLPVPIPPPAMVAVRLIVKMLQSAADQHEQAPSRCKGCMVEQFADVLMGNR